MILLAHFDKCELKPILKCYGPNIPTFVSHGKNCIIHTYIIPSQMEVAPPHRTVDIRQKRRLFKDKRDGKDVRGIVELVNNW